MKQFENDDGLVIVDENKYGNIAKVTHSFNGSSTIEDAIRDIVLAKLKEDNLIKEI